MEVLMTVLYILLFLIFISILIVLHELGHFLAAKYFKVYCMEFSVGMGPLLLKRKKENSETQFSFRAVPFGGYVSMVSGEEGDDSAGDIKVPLERTIKGISKWKKLIIFVAGVVMNIITAILIFFIAAWVPRNLYGSNMISISSQISESINIKEGDYGFVFTADEELYNKFAPTLPDTISLLDMDSTVYYKNGDTLSNVLSVLDYTEFSFSKTKIQNYLNFYLPLYDKDENGNDLLVISKEKIIDISKVDYVDINLKLIKDENDTVQTYVKNINVHALYDEKNSEYYYEDLGITTYVTSRKANNLGDAFKSTFDNFGNATTIVFESLKMIFTDKEAIQSVGGIVAVGFTTTSYLKNYGWYYFLYMWGVISVNLALLNLFPFPGLDGWHLLVTIIEGITRKEIPPKVKNIVSFIGLSILILLMIVLLFKDAFTYIFHIGVSLL